ncbi:unnamed protein product [Closterium sp. NIES-53]
MELNLWPRVTLPETSPTPPGGGGGSSRAGAGGTRAASPGGTGAVGAGGAGGVGSGGLASAGGAAGAGGVGASGVGSAGGAGGAAGAGCAGATSAGGTGGPAVTRGTGLAGALRHLLGLPPAPTEFPVAGTTPLLLFPQLLPHSLLPAPAPYTARAVLPSPPASSLPAVADPPSDLARASSPTVTHFLATVVTDPTLSSPAASTLVAELVDFAAVYRLDYLASLVFDPDPTCPPSVGGEVALGCDVLEDRQEELECLAATAPHLATMLLAPEGDLDALNIPTPCSCREAISGEYYSQWQTTMDAKMASWKFTGTYVDEVPPPGANIVSGMWIFKVKRPPGSPPTFKARYVARGFSQREGVDFFQTFSPTPKMTTLQAELQERHTCTDLGELWSYLGLQITRDRARRTITLTQSHMVHQVLQRFDFQFSSPQPTPLSTGHSLSAPPLDESVEPSGPYPELVVVLTRHSDASWADDQATQRSSQGYTFSLGSGSVSWRSTRSSSVLGSSYEAKIYAGSMAAQELRWLTYLLTDLEERPRSPPVLYVDNKAMLALCHEQRQEHRTKHIALRYFLARELQHRRQLRLSYVASRANTADVFTKALGSGDHQRFCTALGLVPTLPHLLVS